MAAKSNHITKLYEPKTSDRVITKIFNEKTADIFFSFPRGEIIDAHKALLSALSTVFNAMFSGNWKESSEVEIVDASFGTFLRFMKYFYSEIFVISTENVSELINLANKYEIHDLVAACESFLLETATVDNVMDWITLACMFGLDALKTKCREIMCEHTENVIESESFLQCDNNILFEVLSIDRSTCPEEKIFDACINWAQNKCNEQEIDAGKAENIRRTLGNCFDRIRFKDMRFEEFSKRPSLHKNLFNVDEVFGLFAIERTDRNTRYRSTIPIIFQFQKSLEVKEGCNKTHISISKRMRLKSVRIPEEIYSKLNFHPNFNWDKVSIRGARGTLHHWMRRATLKGMDWFEFEIAPIFEPDTFYAISCGHGNTYRFNLSTQTVLGVTLSHFIISDLTCFSALHFEECDESL